MKTITVKGKVYEVGLIYATETGCGKLMRFIEEDDCFEIMNDDKYTIHSDVFEMSAGLGTIKDAPIELEDGDRYEFAVNGTDYLGFYYESRNAFFNGGNKICGAGQADNIAKLKVIS